MSMIGIIPARSGSKGIPNKNIKLLGDLPLLCYSIKSALDNSYIERVIVSTDSHEIQEIAINHGATCNGLRPQELSTDESPTIDTILYEINKLEEEGLMYDHLCLLQPTCPFRNPKDVNFAIESYLKSDSDTLITVREVPSKYNPYWIYKERDNGLIKLFLGEDDPVTRRQELPTFMHRDGSLYISSVESIKKNKSLYGNRIMPFAMKNSPDINIDTSEDWMSAVNYLSNSFE